MNGDKSLLQQTVERLLKIVSAEDIIVMTNSDYKFHVLSDLNSLFSTLPLPVPIPVSNVILEPLSRNTAPAIALGIKFCIDRLGCKEDEVIFISPADHVIRPEDKFAEYVKLSGDIAKDGYIVTFGINPDRPETGYGYIKAGKGIGTGKDKENTGKGEEAYKVERFVEKPDLETAKRYVKEGNYFWNSGMFAFKIGTMLDEIKTHSAGIHERINNGFDDMVSDFEHMPDISIDYSIMERSDKVVTLPLNLYWNDIGSWDSLYDVMEKDGDGNVRMGDVISIDTKDTLVIGNKRLISTIGLENCLIVETDDAILIAKKGEAQKVKDVVRQLKENKRTVVDEHVTTFRPWGNYTVLEEGPRYKIKRIVVNPNEKLSLQMHYHRSEHWVVVNGTAKVTVGEKELFIHENESTYIPKSTIHRLENPGRVPLEIIEVQNGEYVGEDDIVRCEDVYGR